MSAAQVNTNLTHFAIALEDGTKFILPRRKRNPQIMALAFVYFVVAITSIIISFYLLSVFGWRGVLWGKLLLFLGVSLMPLLQGIVQQLATNSASITIKSDRLIIPPSLPGKPLIEIPLATIARFELDIPPPFLARIGYRTPRLLVEHFNGTRTVLIVNYPPKLLEKVAYDLRAFTNAHIPSISFSDVSSIPEIERDVLSKPAESKITMHHEGNLHSFYIPFSGIFQKRNFLLIYMFTMCINILIFGQITVDFIFSPPRHRLPAAPFFAGIAGLLLLSAIICIFLGLHYRLRKVVLVIRERGPQPSSFTCTTKGLLGKTELNMPGDGIRAVSTRSNRMLKLLHLEQDKERFAVLYLVNKHGRKKNILGGHELDMRWLATRIRQLLDTPRR